MNELPKVTELNRKPRSLCGVCWWARLAARPKLWSAGRGPHLTTSHLVIALDVLPTVWFWAGHDVGGQMPGSVPFPPWELGHRAGIKGTLSTVEEAAARSHAQHIIPGISYAHSWGREAAAELCPSSSSASHTHTHTHTLYTACYYLIL